VSSRGQAFLFEEVIARKFIESETMKKRSEKSLRFFNFSPPPDFAETFNLFPLKVTEAAQNPFFLAKGAVQVSA
jgi:hypothetical protein